MSSKKTRKKELPWYTITMLLTVLGAISIFMLFGVYYYNDQGIVFWSIIVSWITILLGTTLEVSYQERQRRELLIEKEQEIKKLKKELDEIKNLKVDQQIQ